MELQNNLAVTWQRFVGSLLSPFRTPWDREPIFRGELREPPFIPVRALRSSALRAESFLGGALSSIFLSASLSLGATEPTDFKFDFGSGRIAPGYIQVLPTTVYTPELGYGFDLESKVSAVDRGGNDVLRSGFCTSDRPFYFSVKVPEGNYRVTVVFGDPAGATTNTIKAESRRLMLEQVVTAPGQFETRTFTVNVRTPSIRSGGQVRLKARELGPPPVLHWDDKLTVEFNGARPGVCALEIARVENAITIYLAGDSTVTDQPLEPWNSWGQMLPRFFNPGVAIANHAESGESLKSFLGARRLDKILSTMKAGDYLFIQFGHNDQKDKSPGAGAMTTYESNLFHFIAVTRQHAGIPVLVTSMERKAGVVNNTLGEYPEATRQAAKEANVALLDLHAMSKVLYAALGQDLDRAFQDGTHHNNYGSYELARCIVEGIRTNQLGIARYLADDLPSFDPNHPDPLGSFAIPASPLATRVKPEGN
jgi:lysophospholipase L1-like esterase